MIALPDAEIARLRTVAEAATPGPWTLRPLQYDDWGWLRAADGLLVASAWFESRVAKGWREATRYDSPEWKTGPPEVAANAEFLAEFNPSVALALLAEIARLREENVALKSARSVFTEPYVTEDGEIG